VINENFVFVGAVIYALGSIGYLRDTLRGTVKPNRVTWFIWTIAPLLAFFAQIGEGVGLHQSLLTFMAGFIPLLILTASFFNKKAYWKLGRLDIICGVLSILGLVWWLFSGTGLIAIILAIIVDFIAAVPTIIKGWKFPETENWVFFFVNAISAGITLLTITVWNYETFLFPLYIFIICVLFTLIIKFKVGKRLV
jgi:hypothetical protein